jgi:hypothetical protein
MEARVTYSGKLLTVKLPPSARLTTARRANGFHHHILLLTAAGLVVRLTKPVQVEASQELIRLPDQGMLAVGHIPLLLRASGDIF